MRDLIVVGRYPDENLPGQLAGDARTVDIIPLDSEATITRLSDPQAKGLVSVSAGTVSIIHTGLGATVMKYRRAVLIGGPQELEGGHFAKCS